LALPAEVVKRTVEQAKSLATEEIIRTLDLLAETDRELRFTGQPRLLVELCAVRVCREPARAAAPPLEAGAGAEAAAPEPPAARREAQPEAREEAAEEPGGIGEMKRRWDEVIADLRKRRQGSVAAFVHEATPVELAEEALTLAFNHQFHYDQMAKDEKRQRVVSEAVERVTGQTLKIKCRLVGEPARPGKEPAKGKPSARPAGKRQAEPVEDLMSLFPGSQVEE
jgi:DNA polymerase III gamma/tau subunit